ncbi:MAG: hypothetical protein HQL73_11575 [Magnetococcales bacterium]|nr:hypothetical protein [Magnetococcales bacterium]
MDPLRFRQRRLFRRQALDGFVGAFGDASTPELLTPFPVRAWRWWIVLVLGSLMLWGILGSLPMRVAVTGQLAGVDSGNPYLTGWVREGDPTSIRTGQPVHLSCFPNPLPTIATRVVSLSGPALINRVVPGLFQGRSRIIMELDGEIPGRIGMIAQSHSGHPVTAWVTVGHQPPWRALLSTMGYPQTPDLKRSNHAP